MPTNNFQVSQGSGTTIATEQGTQLEHYQKIKLIDPTLSSTSGIGVASNPLKIDPTGTTTQPVSIASMPSTPVTGTFFQAIQPISVSTLPLPSGAATDSSLTNGNQKIQIVQGGNTALVSSLGALSIDINQIGTNALGQELMVASIPVVIASDQSSILVKETAANLVVSTTAATGVAVTATLPAVASQFHYIGMIEIVKYFTVANAASATPLVVTTTNLPGSLAFTFGQPLGAIGVTDRVVYSSTTPIKSSVVNTATTIVCPATTGIIWRVNVFYFSAF